MQPIKRPAISKPLLFTFLVPLVVGFLLFLLVLLSFQTARRVAVAAQEQTIAEIADFSAELLERYWIAPRERTVRVLSDSAVFRRRLHGTADVDELIAEWRHVYDLHEGYFFIYYGLEDGTIELYPDLPLPEGFDHRIRPWYRAGMKSDGDPAWSPPYDEIITGKTIMSTTMPILDGSGTRIGVFAIDLTFAQLAESLGAIPLPTDAVVCLADEQGKPFVGSDQSYRSLDGVPETSESLLIYRTRVLRNGWQMVIAVPRDSLVRAFAEAAVPFLVVSVVVYLVLFGSLVVTVLRLGSRARRLAAYFVGVMDGNEGLRSIFRTRDEFADLNHGFNNVLHAARVTEAERLAQERVYRELIEHTAIGFFKLSRPGKPTYVNSFCAEMLGYDREQLLGLTTVFELFHDPADRRNFLRVLLRDGEARDYRVKLLRKSGDPIWVAVTAVMNRVDPSAPQFEIDGFMVDATEHVVEHSRLKHHANTDPLTGLANRRALETAFRETVVRYQTCSLVFFDIDKFKHLNDHHGHDVGDKILRQIAAAATEVLREDDIFARYGGDEFAVFLPGASIDKAVLLAERLRTTIRAAKLPGEMPPMPSISIGVVERKNPSWSLADMVIHADQALYRSKAAGGDTVSVTESPTR